MDMTNAIKVKISTERIINIVNSMRNQIRNLGSNDKEKFSLNQMVQDLHVLTQNEIYYRDTNGYGGVNDRRN